MKRLLFTVAAAAALWIAACGGSGTQTPPPPQGMYSLASLNGTYAFMTSGELITSSGVDENIARVGSFQADGQGNITSGIYDLNISTFLSSGTPNTINTGSKYTVNADGRGTLTLNVNSAGVATTLNFGIVLTSTSDGLMMDETSTPGQNSSGSGNFIKQNTAQFQAATVNGIYSFDFAGVDNVPNSPAPLSIVGEFDASSGVISNGFEDVNDGNNLLSNGAISPSGGSFTPDPNNFASFGRGTVTIAGEPYAFYIVDGTRVRFIDASTTSGNLLSGDAVIQDATVPSGVSGITSSFVYLVAGSSASGGVTRLGRFTSTGGALTQVHVDTNAAPTGSDILTDHSASSGSIAVDSTNPGIPGRFLLTITNGSAAPFTAVLYFSSSSSGVLQETSVTGSAGNQTVVDVADGSFNAQTGGPFTNSNVTGPYAFNWSGSTTQNNNGIFEEDVVGQFKASNLSLSGTSDQYELSLGPATDLNTTGSITIGGDGTTSTGTRSTMNITPNSRTVQFVVYFVNPQLAFFANNNGENSRIAAGILQAQH